MGTHPIFESDFDCLTDVCFVLDQLKKCVTSLPIFLLNSVETMPQMLLPSKPSSEASVLMPMKKKMNKVISELSGKAIADVLAEGKEKLASVPSGGGAAPAAGAAAAGGAEEAPAAEAKKESSSEDEDEDMGFGLFD